MLDIDLRKAIFILADKGHSARFIARALDVSRTTVGKVLDSKETSVPIVSRPETCLEHMDKIKALYTLCNGNIVRVWEKLGDDGVHVPYTTLTAFCRRHKIGVEPKKPSGTYTFLPGQEMQHDTSPHRVKIGGVERLVQCASLVLCYSHTQFAQCYPTFNRFYCKVFMTEALRYLDGAAEKGMVDNSNVVVGHGTGSNMVPAPEMAAFAERFNFKWIAHEKGDANRSARVERPFDHIENNFYPGRTFADLEDLNNQLRAWCDKNNATYRKKLHASHVELYAAEKPHLQPLPPYIPEVYDIHWRDVDSRARVSLHSNRYYASAAIIGERVEIRESISQVRILFRHQVIATHPRLEDGRDGDSVLPEQEAERRQHRQKRPMLEEEAVLRAAAPELAALVDILRGAKGRTSDRIKQLYHMYLEYPTESLVAGVRAALEYGQTDLGRIERIVLRNIAGDFFKLPFSNKEPSE
jgi:transposase